MSKLRKILNNTPLPQPPKGWASGATFDGTEGEATSKPMPASDEFDPAEVLRENGFDPDLYEVDAVSFSVWDAQTPEGTEKFTSRRFKFRLRVDAEIDPLSDYDFDDAISYVRQYRPLTRRTLGSGLGEPVTEVVNLADVQLYKSENGGVDATIDRVLEGLDSEVTRIKDLRERGVNVDEIILVNNGDPIENIAGNYASQLHTVEGGLRAQLKLALELWQQYATTLFPMVNQAQFVSVLCNHGEFGRLGGPKNRTGDSDNAGGFLAEALQMILDGAGYSNVEWTIPHDEMNVYTRTQNGVLLGFNHGHKIPGNGPVGFEKWLNGQVRGDQQAWEADIWVTAHRHHFESFDLGSAFAFACPSCDGGSKWLRDSTGRFSRAGILSFVVDPDAPMQWRDAVIL